MVEPARRDAAWNVALRLVLEGRRHVGRRREPPRLPVQLNCVTVWRLAPVRRPVRDIFNPSAQHLMRLEPRHEALQRRVVADAQSQVTNSRGGVRGQLERVPFIVAPAAEIDRIA